MIKVYTRESDETKTFYVGEFATAIVEDQAITLVKESAPVITERPLRSFTDLERFITAHSYTYADIEKYMAANALNYNTFFQITTATALLDWLKKHIQ